MQNNLPLCIKVIDKKQLKRFYQEESYSAGLKGFDTAYGLYNENQLICAVIISQLTKTNEQALLHGLVTRSEMKSMGFASQLLQRSISTFRIQHSITKIQAKRLICFIKPNLLSFYQRNHFQTCEVSELNLELSTRYKAYKKHQSDLTVMAYRL